MLVYCCIDGKDNFDTSSEVRVCMPIDGVAAMSQSHVRRMVGRGFQVNKYFPGTRDRVTGMSSSKIVDDAMAWIRSAYGDVANADKKLFLGGSAEEEPQPSYWRTGLRTWE